MKSLAHILNEHPYFQNLPDGTIELIAGCAKNVVFKENEYLLKEGADANEFYLMRTGKVALEIATPGRGELTFMTLDAGDLVGVSWLIKPYRWVYDARAIEETRVLAFDAKCLRDKCDADHEVGYQMMQLFVTSLVQRVELAIHQMAHMYSDQRQGADA